MAQIVGSILSNSLYVSLLVILVSSLIGFYVQSRARDRCLRDFDGFMVTIEGAGKKVIWGKLRVYSSGIELLYASTHQDSQGHVENSYILYDNELGALQAIYRFHDDQSAEGQLRRKKDIQRTHQPTIFRRAARGLRNVFSTFKDAIIQTTNTFLGHRASQSPQNLVLTKHKELASSGAKLLNFAAGNAYEPILERYVGQHVIMEIVSDGTRREEYGILKEYSAKYIELLNVKLEVPLRLYLKGRQLTDESPVKIERRGETVRLSHTLERTILVEAVRCGTASRNVDIPVDSGHTIDLELEEGEMDKPVTLDLSVRCLADLLVPRTMAVVRHAGKREKLSLDALLGLDALPYLPWVKGLVGVGDPTTTQTEHE